MDSFGIQGWVDGKLHVWPCLKAQEHPYWTVPTTLGFKGTGRSYRDNGLLVLRTGRLHLEKQTSD